MAKKVRTKSLFPSTPKEHIRQLVEWMSQGVFEKEQIIAVALLCAVAGENMFLLGPPGTAKSMVASRSSTPRMFLISLFVYRASPLMGIFDDSNDDLSSLKSFLNAMTSVMRVLISSSCSEIYFSLYILKTTFRF